MSWFSASRSRSSSAKRPRSRSPGNEESLRPHPRASFYNGNTDIEAQREVYGDRDSGIVIAGPNFPSIPQVVVTRNGHGPSPSLESSFSALLSPTDTLNEAPFSLKEQETEKPHLAMNAVAHSVVQQRGSNIAQPTHNIALPTKEICPICPSGRNRYDRNIIM